MLQQALSLKDVVSGLASDLFASANATKTALNGHNDLYHFQMAIHEHGEQKVVEETTTVLKDRHGCTHAEASIDAGHRVRAALELVAGQDTFKTVRDNLNR